MRNLTPAEEDKVRNLVRRSPAFIGMRVAVHNEHVAVLAPEELEVGLGPVFNAVADAPPAEWPTLVDECLTWILRALTDGSPELDGPTEALLSRVYARLRPIAGSPTQWWTYAREVAPGLLMVLALDHPHHISILTDEQVSRHGHDRLLEAGLDNLCTQLPDTFAMSDEVYIVSGGDYVASAALVLPWVIESATGVDGINDMDNGALVAMPDHNTLIFHPITTASRLHHALTETATLTAERHNEAENPLSAYVHWWQPGTGYLEAVAHAAPDDSTIGADVVTSYPPAFMDLLTNLAAEQH